MHFFSDKMAEIRAYACIYEKNVVILCPKCGIAFLNITKKQKKKKNYFMKKMNRVLSLLIVVTLSLSQAWAERVSRDDAALVANNFMNVASSNSAIKKTPAKKMVMKSVPAQEENQYYVYENENGEGWVIVAANDVITPILAYSETGHFRTDNMPVNVRKWMGKYNDFVKKIEADGATQDEVVAQEWTALKKSVRKAKGDAVVGPLVKTTWDQDSPYWNSCPGSGTSKAYTGCVATAMAQVMKYWEWPKKGTGSHSYQPLDPNTGAKSKRYGVQTVNFGETTYDWANMKDSYTGSYTTAEGTAVATLMYHCGVATEMMYGNDDDGGSGTMSVNYEDWDWGTTVANEGGCAQNALWYYFGYKKPIGYVRDGYTEEGHQYYEKWSDTDWTAMIKAELDLQRPIIYSGGDEQSGGHCFICDGYDDAGYFHFNWGWSGQNDGYYKLSNLKPGSGGAGGGGYDFTANQDVIVGIMPDKPDYPEVTVTWSVKGVTSTTTFTQYDDLVLPTAPADCSESNVFVGWTKSSSVSGEKPADLFTDAKGKSVTEAVTYYAVFAEVSEGESTPQEVATVTFATAANDGTQDCAEDIKNKLVSSDYGVASYSGVKLYKGKEGVKMGAKSATGSITLTLSASTAVSKVIVNASQYGSDTGKLTVTAGSTQLGDAQTPGSNLEFAAESDVTTDEITIATTSKRAYVASISVISGKGASYSNYSLACGSTTDVENVNAEQASSKKLLINGQLFIQHDGRLYNVQGTRVK